MAVNTVVRYIQTIYQNGIWQTKRPHTVSHASCRQFTAKKAIWQSRRTYSMEQSPSWEANWFSASPEIPRILWNPKVHYSNHKCPPPDPILSQLDPVHTLTSHFLKIHLNIILPFMPGSPKWSISLRFPHQNPVYASPLPHTRYMPRPFHSSRFITRTILGEEYRSLSSSLCSFLHSPVTSSLLAPNIAAAITKAVPVERQKPFTVQQCCGHPLSFHVASFSFLNFSLFSYILPTLASFLSTSLSLLIPSLTCLSLVVYPFPFRFIFYLTLLRFRILLPLSFHISFLFSFTFLYLTLRQFFLPTAVYFPASLLHFFLILSPTKP